jgi:NAD(P)-dependent dehydrogenase (short-subunit alcohol dehydrogenase family)
MTKKTSTALFTAQLLTGVVAAAAAYALKPRPAKRNQIVVITGASRGLGLALAERFGRAGAKLVLASRDLDELIRARNLLVERQAVQSQDDVLVIPADLTDYNQAFNLIDHAVDHFGRIDVLINNAGIMEVGPVQNQPLDAYHRAMDTNFFAALHTIHAALPRMLRRPKSAGDAAIVNIASIGGKFSMPHLLPYNASKFALVGLSEGLHAELRHKGIRVTTVCPGLMRTGGEAHARYVGQIEKERRWFQLAARTPILAASVKCAADRIFQAVAAGRAEITITPQAWLAARLAGLAPNTTQYFASLANHLVLPNPTPSNQLTLRFNLSSSDLYRNSQEEEIGNPS